MAINFPTSLDDFTNPIGTDTQDSPDHAAQHANKNDAVEALEAKVGIDNSAVAASHDYKIDALETAPPGHEASHESGGGDPIKLDDLAAPDDNTDLNTSNAKHGLMKKLTDEVDKYFDASGNFVITALLEYERDIAFAAKPVGVAADRYKILSPNRMFVYFNSKQFYLSSQATLDLSLEATWDSVATDYRVAATRAGLDFYIYACNTATRTPDILVSVNSSAPTGYNTTTSKKIGGFHCLCVAVGTIASHTLTDYLAGDVLPQSVYDLKFMPESAPEGMVYDSGTGKWVDIYLASVSGTTLISLNGGTIADGASAVKFHWYKFVQWLGRQKKKLPNQAEFMALSYGANQGTNITGDADPGTTTGHTDSVGRRMISNIGCEDCCGVLWQWGRDRGGGQSAASWADAYDANDDAGSLGQHYLAPNCVLFGGDWDDDVGCGSRGSVWDNGPLLLYSGIGARGLSENRGD